MEVAYNYFLAQFLFSENLKETRVIMGSINMGYVSTRNQTRHLLSHTRAPIHLGHGDGRDITYQLVSVQMCQSYMLRSREFNKYRTKIAKLCSQFMLINFECMRGIRLTLLIVYLPKLS